MVEIAHSVAILVEQNTGFALFCGIGNCSKCGVMPPRIALAILVEQNAGFALFCLIVKENTDTHFRREQ